MTPALVEAERRFLAAAAAATSVADFEAALATNAAEVRAACAALRFSYHMRDPADVEGLHRELWQGLAPRLRANATAAEGRGFGPVEALYRRAIGELPGLLGDGEAIFELLRRLKDEVVEYCEAVNEGDFHEGHPAVLCCQEAEGLVSAGGLFVEAMVETAP